MLPCVFSGTLIGMWPSRSVFTSIPFPFYRSDPCYFLPRALHLPHLCNGPFSLSWSHTFLHPKGSFFCLCRCTSSFTLKTQHPPHQPLWLSLLHFNFALFSDKGLWLATLFLSSLLNCRDHLLEWYIDLLFPKAGYLSNKATLSHLSKTLSKKQSYRKLIFISLSVCSVLSSLAVVIPRLLIRRAINWKSPLKGSRRRYNNRELLSRHPRQLQVTISFWFTNYNLGNLYLYQASRHTHWGGRGICWMSVWTWPVSIA